MDTQDKPDKHVKHERRNGHELQDHDDTHGTQDTALVLVPGLAPHARSWLLVERHARRVGFEHVATVADLPHHLDVARLADHLARHVDALQALGTAQRVHIVGQNLGGLVARYFVQVLGGDAVTDTVVTLGTPHRGTLACPQLASAAQLQPGSFLLRRLADSSRPAGVRWVNYLSGRDAIVQPASYALLTREDLAAENVVVTDQGDLSLVISPRVARSLVHRLAGGSADTDPLVAPPPTAAVRASMARHPSRRVHRPAPRLPRLLPVI